MNVKFNEEKDMRKNKDKKINKKSTFDVFLVKKGIAKNKRQANIILVSISLLFFFLSFVILNDTYNVPSVIEELSQENFN